MYVGLVFWSCFVMIFEGVHVQFCLLFVVVIYILANCLLPRMYLIARIWYRLSNHWHEILCFLQVRRVSDQGKSRQKATTKLSYEICWSSSSLLQGLIRTIRRAAWYHRAGCALRKIRECNSHIRPGRNKNLLGKISRRWR